MIIFENTEVWGFDHAVRGMRNPLNSWDKSDSKYFDDEVTNMKQILCEPFVLGDKDRDLCQRLINGGPEHRKFLRQIFVAVDITAPLYWWKEFDTYKVGTVANSCSTMHKITAKEFVLDDFSCEHLIDWPDIDFPTDEYEQGVETALDDIPVVVCLNDNRKTDYLFSPAGVLRLQLEMLNKCRDLYLKEKDPDTKKKYWWQLIQLLPSSYNQRRTITMNYENLRSMYIQREFHKQDEWRIGFCDWVKTLPYAKELIIFDPLEPPAMGMKE